MTRNTAPAGSGVVGWRQLARGRTTVPAAPVTDDEPATNGNGRTTAQNPAHDLSDAIFAAAERYTRATGQPLTVQALLTPCASFLTVPANLRPIHKFVDTLPDLARQAQEYDEYDLSNVDEQELIDQIDFLNHRRRYGSPALLDVPEDVLQAELDRREDEARPARTPARRTTPPRELTPTREQPRVAEEEPKKWEKALGLFVAVVFGFFTLIGVYALVNLIPLHPVGATALHVFWVGAKVLMVGIPTAFMTVVGFRLGKAITNQHLGSRFWHWVTH